jgi:hypothetical protein
LLPLILNISIAKIVFKLLSVPVRFCLFVIFFQLFLLHCEAQEDSLSKNNSDTVLLNPLPSQKPDKTFADTSVTQDSLLKISKPKKKEALEDKVIYTAEDSMIISISGKIMHLYGKANVKYTDIELNADYILLDMANKEVFAKGRKDTSGVVIGSPVFKQGSEEIESDSMRYNFDSKKGIIFNIITKQGEGYFQSERTKREANENIDAIHNKYTTCDLKHPHFYLAMSKALVIPQDKIVTGPAYMVVADIPLPLFVPFGFFPNTTKSASGILMPTYENGGDRGFGLRDGGWYQVMGEYADLIVKGSLYSRGSWGINPQLRYKYKYHYSGNFAFQYNVNKKNDDISYTPLKDYSVIWSHSQDAKANPNQNFSASVRFSSRENDRRNSYETQNYTESTRSSSINYTRSFPKSGANLSISGSATQNSQSKNTSVNLPTGSFNLATKYPFRKEGGAGKYKWYENISVGYRSVFDNRISTIDSLLFKPETLKNMQNGFKQDIPVALSLKIGKLLTISPSLTYTGMIYSKYVNKHYEYPTDSTFKAVFDTVQEWKYLQAVNPSISIGIAPKIYGMYVSKKEDSYIMAVRHMMTPSASFSFTPDMPINPNYVDSIYHRVNDTLVVGEEYSKYKGIYGIPSSNRKQGSFRFSLNNNLEMKVRPKNDTTGVPKKVVILDNLNFSSGYNPFKETNKWDDVSFTTGTKIFNNKMDIRINGRLSPYALNDTADVVSRDFYYEKSGQLFRLTNISVTSGFSLRSEQGNKKDGNKETNTNVPQNIQNDALINDPDQMDFIPGTSQTGKYVDFSVPWSANISYSWSYSKPGRHVNISHTININGDFSLTPKWKVGYTTNYDLYAKKISFSTFSFVRDLHCWQMAFTVVPFGPRASYSFRINAKSSLLQDLKYEQKPNTWYNNF